MDQISDQICYLNGLIAYILSAGKVIVHAVKSTEFKPLNLTTEDIYREMYMDIAIENNVSEAGIEETKEEIMQDLADMYPERLTWNFVPFAGVHTLLVSSRYTGMSVNSTDEHRYAGEDFVIKISSDRDLTLQHYIVGVYHMKRFKYDSWHELFQDADFNFDGKTVSMKITFNYGCHT